MNEKGNITGLNRIGAEAAQQAAEQPQEQRPIAPAEVERIVEQILDKHIARFRAEVNEHTAQARSEGRAEGERLAGMSEDERRRCEAEAVKAREEELSRREAELNRRELRAWVAQELIRRGLPGELADVIDCTDAERCAACVDALDRTFRTSVQHSVDERLSRGRALPRSGGDNSTRMNQRLRLAAGLADT